MDLSSGLPFWLIKDGLPFDYPSLNKPLKTDVVVIGAGISGALMGFHLIERGISAIVVDRRSIGLGSTCASTSLLQYEIDEPLHRLVDKRGYKNAVRCYQLCSKSINSLYRIAGKIKFTDIQARASLYYAAYKKDLDFLKKEYKIRRENGFRVQWLDEKMVSRAYGFDAPAAILSAQAAQTNAYSFTHALHQYSIKLGLKVYGHTEIISTKHSKTGIRLRTADGIVINAKKLVYATGYEAVELIEKKLVKLKSTYATVSEQFTDIKDFWKDNCLIWNTADPYLYLRVTADNRILVGGRDEDFFNPARRDKLIRTKTAGLVRDVNRLFPSFAFKPEFSWTGTFGSTPDGLPFIGSYEKRPNSFFSLGFGGNGITFSLIAAEIITDLILGKKNKDAALFSFERI